MLSNLFKSKEKEILKKDNSLVQRSYHSVTEEEIKNYAEGNNSDLKVIHFTHTDIGGKVCSLIGQRTFANIETVYCSNRHIDDVINTFILLEGRHTDYDLILVSDVSLNSGTMINLNNVANKTSTKVVYYNHQDLNLKYKEKYSWAIIETEYNGVAQDSTSIMLRYMKSDFNMHTDEWIETLTEKSRRYTKWEWQELSDEIPNQLSTLCHDSGHDFFVRRLVKKHIALAPLVDDEDYDKLEYLEEKYQEYKKLKINETTLTKINDARVGVVCAEQYIDRLASDIPLHYKNIDAVVIINSLAAVNVRNASGYSVSAKDIVKVFGGDGQLKASGAAITTQVRESVINHFINYSIEKSKKIKN